MGSSERKVVITGSRDNFPAMKRVLSRRGFSAVPWPAIEIRPLAFSVPKRDYDWIVLTSRNAVSVFAGKAGRGFFRGKRTAVIGKETAAALSGKGINADFVHRKPGSKDFVGDFSRRFAVKGRAFLLPASSLAGPAIPAGIAEKGGSADVLAVYRTVSPFHSRKAVRGLARGGPYGFIFFSSPSAFENFISTKGLEPLLRSSRTAAIGPTTAAAMALRGIVPDITGEGASFGAVLEEIMEYEDAKNKKTEG